MAKKRLLDDIKEFQNKKKKLVPVLIVLGTLGLILPVLPGLAILFLAFLLIFPNEGENILNKFREFFKRFK